METVLFYVEQPISKTAQIEGFTPQKGVIDDNILLICTGIFFSVGPHAFLFYQNLTIPFSPSKANLTDSDYTIYTCICAVLSFLSVTTLVIVLKIK
jgi:hypothetical protein